MTEPSDPTPKELASPLFEAIWQTIKTWDINAPWYSGYCGATGNHAAVILRALTTAVSGSPQVEAGTVEVLAREIGSTELYGDTMTNLEYVLRRGAAAIGLRPSYAKDMLFKLAECQALVRPREQEGGEAPVAREALIAAYMAGWHNSGEGRNAEYPEGLEDKPSWIEGRDEDINEIIVAHLSAHPAPLPADGWNYDMASAPRDGSHLLIASSGLAPPSSWYVAEAYWSEDGNGWWQANTHHTDYHDGQIFYAAAWQHLPTPPASTEGV